MPRDVHANQAGHAVNGDGRKPAGGGRVIGKKTVLAEQVRAYNVTVSPNSEKS